MDITYLGHSAFKLKGKLGTVVTDPFHKYVGFEMPNVSADIVTVSHDHQDHNQVAQVKSSARRERPFIVDQPGEYEVGGISIFGYPTFHDEHSGTERGTNTIFVILLDNLRVCHLGDLGHPLSEEQISEISPVDVLLTPVGGVFTINPDQAIKTIHAFEPSYAIPMHFKTQLHDDKVFGEMATAEDFLKEYGMDPKPEEKLIVERSKLPEETELVVLSS